MHFIAYVVTEEKPTDAVLAKRMAPFLPTALGKNHKLDCTRSAVVTLAC